MNFSFFKKKIVKKYIYWKFILTRSKYSIGLPLQDSDAILLLTIAFNEVSVIEQQILLLSKNFQDSFYHIIVDNSTDFKIRESIRKICQSNGVGYLGVPLPNPYENNKSHAAAMHWAYYQIGRKSRAKIIGFLDHDIFPLKPYSLKDKMVNGIYGRVMHSYTSTSYQKHISSEAPYWSLWAGFCFFEKSLLKGPFPWSFNFFSKHFPKGYFLDTGGGLWDKVYSNIPYPGTLVTYELKMISDKDEGIQNQSFELLDDAWIHFVSLSNWREISSFDRKKQLLVELLKTALS